MGQTARALSSGDFSHAAMLPVCAVQVYVEHVDVTESAAGIVSLLVTGVIALVGKEPRNFVHNFLLQPQPDQEGPEKVSTQTHTHTGFNRSTGKRVADLDLGDVRLGVLCAQRHSAPARAR